MFGSPDSSSIDGEYEFNESMEDELASGDEFDSEEEEEISMEVSLLLRLETSTLLLRLSTLLLRLSTLLLRLETSTLLLRLEVCCSD